LPGVSEVGTNGRRSVISECGDFAMWRFGENLEIWRVGENLEISRFSH
jgi:hypothetical protein